MNKQYETLSTPDGTLIRACIVSTEQPRGVVQIIHGFGEHAGSYEQLAEFFASCGYASLVHEQRGFGQMPGLTMRERRRARGIAEYADFLSDITFVRSHIEELFPALDIFLFGHSMGGNIAINYLLGHPKAPYRCAVFEAPWLKLTKEQPLLVLLLAGFIGRLSKRVRVSAKLDTKQVSRNEDIVRGIDADPIFHDTISLRLLWQVSCAGWYALRNAGHVRHKSLLLCPGDDKICCPKAMRKFAKANPQVKFIDYPNAYHCLHSDTIQERVLQDVIEFFEAAASETPNAQAL